MSFSVGFSCVLVSPARDGRSQHAAANAATTATDAHSTIPDVFGSPANGHASNHMHRKFYTPIFGLILHVYNFSTAVDAYFVPACTHYIV